MRLNCQTEGGKVPSATTPEVGVSTDSETSEWAMQGKVLMLYVCISDTAVRVLCSMLVHLLV